MMPMFFKWRRLCSTSVMLLIIVMLTLLSTACSGSVNITTPSGGETTTVTAPSGLITPGVLTVGSDTTYPPQEYIDPETKKVVGFDIDLISAIAERMGLKVNVVSTKFDTLLDDLVAKRFDVVISALNITKTRQQKVDFVPYLNAGESLLVQKGNPKNIQGTENLCGLAVGVQYGTVEQGVLQSSSDNCKERDLAPITIIALEDQTKVIELLTEKRVVATYQDAPVTDYYIKQQPDQFEMGGEVFSTDRQGIAVRKNEPALLNAVQGAFNQLKADGTYRKLIVKWGLTNGELTAVEQRRYFA